MALQAPALHRRVILLFDLDCFYASAEMLRRPDFRSRPLAVKQKYLVVTCNYIARERGVRKLQSVDAALAACPDLIVIDGSDIGRYRSLGARVFEIMRRFGGVQARHERLGLDEVFVDITDYVDRELQGNAAATDDFIGHVWRPSAAAQRLADEARSAAGAPPALPDSPAMDLWASDPDASDDSDGSQDWRCSGDAEPSQLPHAASPGGAGGEGRWWSCRCGCARRLALGSHLAARVRLALHEELRLTASCGISCSKLLSKAAASLNKPNQQTVVLPESCAALMAPLPISALPGCGHRTARALRAALDPAPQTCADLLRLGERGLSGALEAAALPRRRGLAALLLSFAAGADHRPVKASPSEPATMGAEDSLRSGTCTTRPAAARVLERLSGELAQRIVGRLRRSGDAPSRVVLSLRRATEPRGRASRGAPARPAAFAEAAGEDGVAALLLSSAEALLDDLAPGLRRGEQIDITLLNVSAAAFVRVPAPAAEGPDAAAEGADVAVETAERAAGKAESAADNARSAAENTLDAAANAADRAADAAAAAMPPPPPVLLPNPLPARPPPAAEDDDDAASESTAAATMPPSPVREAPTTPPTAPAAPATPPPTVIVPAASPAPSPSPSPRKRPRASPSPAPSATQCSSLRHLSPAATLPPSPMDATAPSQRSVVEVSSGSHAAFSPPAESQQAVPSWRDQLRSAAWLPEEVARDAAAALKRCERDGSAVVGGARIVWCAACAAAVVGDGVQRHLEAVPHRPASVRELMARAGAEGDAAGP